MGVVFRENEVELKMVGNVSVTADMLFGDLVVPQVCACVRERVRECV